MSHRLGHVLTVNVSGPEVVGTRRGAPKTSGIAKRAIDGPVRVGRLGLEGDVQVNEHHGGPLQALYAYAQEDLAHWTRLTGSPYDSTVNGENLTTTGVHVNAAIIGERWRIGPQVEAQVTQPRTPCSTLQMRVETPGFVRAFTLGGRPGTYLSVLAGGSVRAGDAIELVHRPAHGVTVADAFAILTTQKHRAEELLDLEGIPTDLLEWARQRTGAAGTADARTEPDRDG